MWLSGELLGLVMPAVYRTAPWRTQTATGGDCQMAEQNRIGAATQRTRIQWKLGVTGDGLEGEIARWQPQLLSWLVVGSWGVVPFCELLIWAAELSMVEWAACQTQPQCCMCLWTNSTTTPVPCPENKSGWKPLVTVKWKHTCGVADHGVMSTQSREDKLTKRCHVRQ